MDNDLREATHAILNGLQTVLAMQLRGIRAEADVKKALEDVVKKVEEFLATH